MLSTYLLLKLVHVLAGVLVLGTGLGIAFFMWQVHRSGNIQAIAVVARQVVLADFVFTTPAVCVQLLSGIALMRYSGLRPDTGWLALALVLYVLVGACWLPVIGLQIRAHRLVRRALAENRVLPAEYHRVMRWWFVLGWPAFLAVIGIFALMVLKPSLWG